MGLTRRVGTSSGDFFPYTPPPDGIVSTRLPRSVVLRLCSGCHHERPTSNPWPGGLRRGVRQQRQQQHPAQGHQRTAVPARTTVSSIFLTDGRLHSGLDGTGRDRVRCCSSQNRRIGTLCALAVVGWLSAGACQANGNCCQRRARTGIVEFGSTQQADTCMRKFSAWKGWGPKGLAFEHAGPADLKRPPPGALPLPSQPLRIRISLRMRSRSLQPPRPPEATAGNMSGAPGICLSFPTLRVY